MACFVSENIKNGVVKQFYYEDISSLREREDVILLDTRTPFEYMRGRADGFINIPLESVGNIFGKDHSTVIASIAKVEKMLKENSDYLIAINEIKEIIKKHGAEKIVFGSDSPWMTPGNISDALNCLELTKEEFDKITYKNACEILKIN